MPDPEEPAQSKTIVERVDGDAYVFIERPSPNIPVEKQRQCPQCQAFAGMESRWCWSCGYDFDRATMPRFHPIKILGAALILSLIVNITLALIVAFLL